MIDRHTGLRRLLGKRDGAFFEQSPGFRVNFYYLDVDAPSLSQSIRCEPVGSMLVAYDEPWLLELG